MAVMGPSGCGKSTLLHLLGGLDRPTGGNVTIDGKALADMKDDDLAKLRRKRIGFVFQFYNLIPVLNAAENAALPVTLDGARPADAKKRAVELAARNSGWARGSRTGRTSFPAGSSSAWRSPAR